MTAKKPSPEMQALAEAVDYLCEHKRSQRELAAACNVHESRLCRGLQKKLLPDEVVLKAPEFFGRQTPEQLIEWVKDLKAQPQYTQAEICVAARKIRGERGYREGVRKEDMPGLLGCSKSEYALIEKGGEGHKISWRILNRLPEAHGFGDMKMMIDYAAKLPEVEHRAHTTRDRVARGVYTARLGENDPGAKRGH